LIYQSFGWTPPIFVHLPIILGPDRKKLSKRDGAKTVFEYLDEGFLPEALVNFLAFLGWAPKGEKELFSQEELIKEFSLERINKNNPIFNVEKLKWFNNQWIKKLTDEEFAQKVTKFYGKYDLDAIKKIAPLVKERLFTLKDFLNLADFFFTSPDFSQLPSIEIKKEDIAQAASYFGDLNEWNAQNIKSLFEEIADKQKIDRVKLIAAVRNIISGKTVTPPLYESMEILGRDETIKRLDEYLKKSNK